MIVYMVYDDTVEPADFHEISLYLSREIAEELVEELQNFCKERHIKQNYRVMEKVLK